MPSIKKSKSHRSHKAIRSRKTKASRSRKTRGGRKTIRSRKTRKTIRSRKTRGGYPKGTGLYNMNTVYDRTESLTVPEYIALYKKTIKEVLGGKASSKNYENATWKYSPDQIAVDLDVNVNVKRVENDLYDLPKIQLKNMLVSGFNDLTDLERALDAGADKTKLKDILKNIVHLDQVMRAYASNL
jgi:hypothetical protein